MLRYSGSQALTAEAASPSTAAQPCTRRISQFSGLACPNGSSISPPQATTSLANAAGFFIPRVRAEAAPAQRVIRNPQQRQEHSIHRDQPLQFF